jgi:Ca2+-binding EF-hand superfamily protein
LVIPAIGLIIVPLKKMAEAQKTRRLTKGSKSRDDNPRDSKTDFMRRVFAEFDKHENGRLTREDLRKVAEQCGLNLNRSELNDMIRFWDSSGTATVSYDDFCQICQEADL